MPDHRGKFSPQFKAEAVQIVIETRKPIAESLVTCGSMMRPWATGSNVAARAPRAGPARLPGGTCACEGARGRDSPLADGRDMVASPIVYRLDTG